MKRRTCIVSAMKCLIPLCMVVGGFAQQRAQAPAREGQGPQKPPLFFKEEWKATEEVPVTQQLLSNPNLEVKLYGPSGKQLVVTGNTAANPPHIWTGLCESTCALALREKNNYVDLTGLAKIKWFTKVSGFHQIRPMLKLADGTWLVGDHTDAYMFDWHDSEFYLGEVRWLKLDIEKVWTRGTWVEKPDLSKVDEIGFTDLMPGSGHGQGGWSDVGRIEVYGKPVKRDATGQ